MNLKTFLKQKAADARFMRGKSAATLHLKNFSEDDKVDYFIIDSIPSLQGVLKDCVKTNIESWLAECASGKYRVTECYDSVIVEFSCEEDAILYRLGGPYV